MAHASAAPLSFVPFESMAHASAAPLSFVPFGPMAHASASPRARRPLCRCTELAELQSSSALSGPRGLVCAEPRFSEPFEWPARASASENRGSAQTSPLGPESAEDD